MERLESWKLALERLRSAEFADWPEAGRLVAEIARMSTDATLRQAADQAHAAFVDPKSDFAGVVKLWAAYTIAHEELTQSKLREWCQAHFLSFLRS